MTRTPNGRFEEVLNPPPGTLEGSQEGSSSYATDSSGSESPVRDMQAENVS